MLELFGKNYFIDIDAITEKCRTEPVIKEDEEDEEESTLQINIFKYEIIKMCLDRILNEYDETDDELGPFGANITNASFKIAFNTLIKYEILIENNE
jgi:hypothetical protein